MACERQERLGVWFICGILDTVLQTGFEVGRREDTIAVDPYTGNEEGVWL